MHEQRETAIKLGIAVVYRVSERNERLLDLHLNQIEKHTRVPYTIYASANRLLPQFLPKLEQHPRVKICDCRPTDLTMGKEHAFYLEQLVETAVADGVTHIATLHVDSFPIRAGWATELAAKLSGTCVLAAVSHASIDQKPNTACMFFPRRFYLQYRPAFHVTERQRASEAYARYRREVTHLPDSGTGYGFLLYANGLTWYPLLRSNKGGEHEYFGSIHGDLIFHLGGAVRQDQRPNPTAVPRQLRTAQLLQRIKVAVKPILPRPVRARLRKPVVRMVNDPMFEYIREQLLANPDAYLHYLRTGNRK